MNTQIQALAMLPKLSEQQLLQALQSGTTQLPTYAVMAELQARKKRGMLAAGADGPPKTSVKDEMLRQPMPGMLPPGMASGGLLDAWNNNEPLGPAIWEWLKRHHERVDANLGRVPSPPAPPDMTEAPRLREQDRTVVDTPSTKPAPKAAPSGIRSVSASVKAPSGAPVPANVPFTSNQIQMGSLGDAMKQVPDDPTLREQLEAYKAKRGDLDKRRENAKWEALIHAGLGVAATPGRFGQAVAQGGLRGMQAYSDSMKGINADDRERMKEMALLSRAASDQQLRRADIANQARVGDANLGVNNERNRVNVYQTQQHSRDVDATNAARLQEARIMASARMAGGSDKLSQLLMNAQTKAENDLKGTPVHIMANMPNASPQAMAAYERALRQRVDANMQQLRITHPEVWESYMQLRGAPAPRGGLVDAVPQGAVIRP